MGEHKSNLPGGVGAVSAGVLNDIDVPGDIQQYAANRHKHQHHADNLHIHGLPSGSKFTPGKEQHKQQQRRVNGLDIAGQHKAYKNSRAAVSS